MSQYLSGEILLQDARLQVEALGGASAVLIVEGEADKRFLAPRWVPIGRVVVGTNKGLVLDAHGAMRESDRGALICLVDCDDDVARGTLQGAPDLIITTHGDLEADLVALGAFRPVVGKVVRGALDSEDRLDEVTGQVLERASACAIALGRLRRAARRAGIALEFEPWNFDHNRSRVRLTAQVDEAAAAQELGRVAGLTATQLERIAQELQHVGSTYRVCNGKDVIAAGAYVLRQDFRVPKRLVDNLPELVQLALGPAEMAGWDVLRRIRTWEQEHGRILFAAG